MCARLLVCLCARACTACVNERCVRRVAVRALASHRGDLRYQKLGLRRALRSRARGCGRCHRPGSRASAAGVTWTRRTDKAQWAGRYAHTSVVDAAGALYVIGGQSLDGAGPSRFQDVWASTDGGARPDYVEGVVGGVLEGYYRGTGWVLKGVLRGYLGGT